MDLEESLDEIRREVGWQREQAAKTAHTVGKVVQAELQNSEKQDQIIVYVIKKKSEKAKPFFDSYKELQKIVQKIQHLSASPTMDLC